MGIEKGCRWSGKQEEEAGALAVNMSFYVSNAGNDAWSGRFPEPGRSKTDGPFATIARARDVVRSLKLRAGLTGPVTVWIRGGRYPLEEPLVFLPQDSGPVTYAAYPGEHPVIDGGRRIDGWREERLGARVAWVTEIPEVAAGRWYFRQLFVNGERRHRPRLPKEGFYSMESVPGIDLCAELFDGSKSFRCAPGDIQAWHNLSDIEVVAFHWWTEERMPLVSFDEETRTVTSSRRSMFALKDETSKQYAKYYVENVFEALTEPGEWYLDRASGKLFYMPMPGETPGTVEVAAPRVEHLLKLLGTPDKAEYVEFLRFEGLTFRHSDWRQLPGGSERCEEESILPKGVDYAASAQASCNVPGAVYLEGTRYTAIDGCRVEHVGWYGVELSDGCTGNRIVGNEIFDMGAGGIKLNGSDAAGPTIRRTGNNQVTDNHIWAGGRVFPGAAGILSMHSFGNEISHNHIHDLYYSGISCGWVWGYRESVSRDNRIEKNHIHTIGQGLLRDMGGIYTLGVQPGTVVRGNVIHDVVGRNYGAVGIYLDEASSHILVEGNICCNTNSCSFHQSSVRGNVVRNNIFVFVLAKGAVTSFSRGASDRRDEIHNFLTFENNIVVADGAPMLITYSDELLEDRGLFSDLNLFWDISGKPFVSGYGGYGDLRKGLSFDEWRALGYDHHSVIADPRFRDLQALDFSLAGDSPAIALGFRPIDVSDLGPRPGHQADG